MISYDNLFEMLDELVVALPPALYKDLNGGVNLLNRIKFHPAAKENDLYIMGEYLAGGPFGRVINIFFGSFVQLYGNSPVQTQKKQLEKILKHELLHHMESLAGENSLGKKDEEELWAYLYDTPI